MGQFFDSLIETYIVVPFAVRYSGAPGEKSGFRGVGLGMDPELVGGERAGKEEAAAGEGLVGR